MNLITRFAIFIFCASLSAYPGFAQPIPGDGNKDGVVNSRDQLILLQNWHKNVGGGTEVVSVELPPQFLRMVRIPAGSFMMGSPDTERSRDPHEGPVHEVTIGYDFYMGETEVTQGQWEAVMGYNAATHSPEGTPWPDPYGVGSNYPVYNVSWDDCQTFLTALNALGQGTFRLPSEAEWEYACRANTTARFYFGDSLGCGDVCENCGPFKGLIQFPRSDYMWYCGNSGGESRPVRQLLPNSFGLYDMSGSVYEWCQDFYRSDYDFAGVPIDGSAWESGGGNGARVLRGGSWGSFAWSCRSAARNWSNPPARFYDIGFRLARTP